MALAIFDLDNTLIKGDSDYLWGEFLATENLVDTTKFQKANQKFLVQYQAGNLVIDDWLEFQLAPLCDYPMVDLYKFRKKFIETVIKPIVLKKAVAKVEWHRTQGDELLIISATNYFITEPIAQLFNIKTLIATKPEIIDNRYTGKTSGTITFQAGKITALKEWLGDRDFGTMYFYSDSHNDTPLLDYVDIAIAIDPDMCLKSTAQKNGWQIDSFR